MKFLAGETRQFFYRERPACLAYERQLCERQFKRSSEKLEFAGEIINVSKSLFQAPRIFVGFRKIYLSCRECSAFSHCSTPNNWIILRDSSLALLSHLHLTGELNARFQPGNLNSPPAARRALHENSSRLLRLRRHGIHQCNDGFRTPVDDRREFEYDPSRV